MDPTYTRVKLKFRDQAKVVRLDRRLDTSLSSMDNLKKLIFKNFSEIEDTVAASARSRTARPGLLHVILKDSDGDSISLDTDEDLLAALESQDRSNIEFQIYLMTPPLGSSNLEKAVGGSWGRNLDKVRDPGGNSRQKQVCRFFGRGHCREGPSCRFVHEIDVSSSGRDRGSHQRKDSMVDFQRTDNPVVFRRQLDYWLNQQLTLTAAENIENLSGENGLQMLSKAVEQRNLPAETITLIVKLLVKEEIRSSLLKQKTNKIYGVLLGSSFLLQLHGHIATQFGVLSPKPEEIKQYLLLVEELQSRTKDGWKEVPLDSLKSVVSKLEDSTAKDELEEIANRLIEQRDKLRWLLATAPPDTCLRGAEFRQMTIVASKEELLSFQARQDLPVNRVGVQYSSVSDYLETHFLLLREDCIDPLRRGIKTYRTNQMHPKNAVIANAEDLRIYSRVQLIGVRCGEMGIEYVLSFHVAGLQNATTQWLTSKRLMFGALLCISSDGFQTFFWGTVAQRDHKDLAKGRVGIRLLGESEPNVTTALQSGKNKGQMYVMVESTAAYFEAYYHVLKSLQREEMETLPFTKYLLRLEPRVSAPRYLLQREVGDKYNFSSVFPNIQDKLGRSSLRILQEWPKGWAYSLDEAQQKALKHALTKELAIIQGPPGTGKTFLGLLLVEVLLTNLKRSSGPDFDQSLVEQKILSKQEPYDISGPLLVLCYTNHALDQFLEGIYEKEANLIRIGGRGKSNVLKGRNLQTLLQQQRNQKGVEGSHRRFYGQERSYRNSLLGEIHECIDIMGTKLATCQLLDGVATQNQIESLFFTSTETEASNKEIVQFWLNDDLFLDSSLAHHFLISSGSPDPVEPPDDTDKTSAVKLLPKSEDDDPWTIVRRRGRRGRPNMAPEDPLEDLIVEDREGQNTNRLGEEIQIDPMDEGIRLQDFVDFPNVWQLNLLQRRKLHAYWLEEIRKNCERQLRELSQKYAEACRTVTEVENEIQLSMLRKAKIVGMTTTAAARHHEILKSLKPEVLIVEEAAEVLEGHILACLSPSLKHLILIGDHLQLRPSVATYRLATEHKLDVSMFERLVRSGVEHVTLQEQRRMRPSISKLVRSLYPKLKDHHSVSEYGNVAGVVPNVYFFDHKASEDQSSDAGSKVNIAEAKLVVELCMYLLHQGCFETADISILTMYTGQLQEIKKLLRKRISGTLSLRLIGQPIKDAGDEEGDIPRVSSVDDYQGEESDIIILSLVRSNTIVTDEGIGKIGFLRIPNRICVALTRARKGLFMFGNADLLAQRSSLWKDVTKSLREDGALGPHLELVCQNHPELRTRIVNVEDFKQVEDGGCSRHCEYQLECGHACPRRCHPGSHDLVVCPKPCLRVDDNCGHQCKRRCHGSENCPPCEVIVVKRLVCHHEQTMMCSRDIKDEICETKCPKILECGHECRSLCGRPCTESCEQKVLKMLPCGHAAKIPCFQDPKAYCCPEPCGAILEGCQHECKGTCSKCKEGTAHIPCNSKCGRILPCGHLCEAGCSLSCPPCPKRCRKRCVHSRCSFLCGDLCRPCREPCAWQCIHHKCEGVCNEVCTRPRCDLPCTKLIQDCGHRCIGLCGEPCPKKCRICHPQTKDVITQLTLDEYEETDLFVQLEDCGHVFEVSGLDTWMDGDEASQQPDGSVSVKLKECPECRSTIWRTHRYSNIVKRKQAQLEEVKKRIYGHEKLREGNLLLEDGKNTGARAAFLQALKLHPGLMEAHFGTGYAFFKERDFDKAKMHFRFVVKHSSFASDLASIIRSDGNPADPLVKFDAPSDSKVDNTLATKALIQWASALTGSRNFNDAIKICDTILRRDPQNELAAGLKMKAEKGERDLVVQAMAADVGSNGHWFTCPNGHFYTIGECGGATEESRCPDCKALVGGQGHKLREDNRPSHIDGSSRPAWPN